ncbi:dicarboxylate/amino acid:cation symporter [Bacillus sp. EB01]|uniref:dicarboxylate/amino acid:cation symporter n=1 Tax=Bacillus sp. EB01 TaxID=1347086 RepID=UPI0005C511DA|nr:dicarboxylate/amino acid:cation symporter [Bacillus sp. EB01]
MAEKKKSLYKRLPLWALIIIGLILGTIIGLLWPNVGENLQPIGTLFIKAIKMIVIPLVFSAVTLGIYKMGSNRKELGRLGGLAFVWFYLATGFCIILGITLNAIFHPAAGVTLQATGAIPENLATSIDWVKFITDLIPDNIVNAMAEQKIIPTLFFAICFGLALSSIGDKAKAVVNFLEGILDAMFKLTQGVVATAPIAVAAIMAWVFATQGGSVILGLAKLIGVMYIGLLVIMVLFWIILASLKINPFSYTKKVMEPLLLGFTTTSSEVTLPVHMKILEKAGIPNKVVSFVLPLGYSFNLDGAALYQSLAVCFIAEAYGMHLSLPTILTILVTTLIANKGTANVPAASLVVLSVILTSLNLPLEAIALITGVDRFMDMGRTAVNVFGNTIAAVLLYKVGGKNLAETVDEPSAVSV